MFSVQMDEQYYRIVGPEGEEGDIVPYGARATLDLPDGSVYMAMIADANEQHPQIFRVDELTEEPCTLDEVELPRDIITAAKALDAIIEQHAGDADDEEEDDGVVDVEATPIN